MTLTVELLKMYAAAYLIESSSRAWTIERWGAEPAQPAPAPHHWGGVVGRRPHQTSPAWIVRCLSDLCIRGTQMQLLIIGGTVFLGRHLVEAALARGHTVTLFNRGQHNPELFPDVEKLRGDRG